MLVVAAVLVWQFGGAPDLHALDPEKAVTQYIIENWNEETGLPVNSVRTLLQTGDGYIWIGTEEGLVRFGGARFEVFDEINTPAITNNFIFALMEDSKKRLWMGTRGGLLVYDGITFKSPKEMKKLAGKVITCLYEDGSGALWIGTDGDWLYRFQDNRLTHYGAKQGVPYRIIKSISTAGGRLWVGAGKELLFFENNRFVAATGKQGLPVEQVNTIYSGREKQLWVGTDKGLFVMRDGRFERMVIHKKDAPIKILSILQDRDGGLWLGTQGAGLIRCNKSKGEAFSYLTKKDGLAGNTFTCIIEDHEGSIWLGSPYSGISRLKDGKFTPFTRKEGLSDDFVFALYEDSGGDLWVGTNNGLNRRRYGTFQTFGSETGLSNTTVNCIYRGPAGFIWVGTDDGLNKCRVTAGSVRKVSEYARGHVVLSVKGDSSGTLWFGTNKQFFKIPRAFSETSAREVEAMTAVVNFIFEDREKRLWFSAYRNGLMRHENNKDVTFTQKEGLVSDSVNCIFQDGEGIIWIGTIDGLSRFEKGSFTSYTRKDGLFNNNIYQILEDGGGYLWMSCNKGIFKVKKEELDHIAGHAAAGRSGHTVHSVVYGKKDGMLSIECNGSLQTPGCKTRDGRLWFPTVKGAVMIDPADIRTNLLPPPVLVEGMDMDGRPVERLGDVTVTVPPRIKRIKFAYTALSFVNPGAVAFKYRLEGYDETWVEAAARRETFYTNLDPGMYTFRVIACNDDGVWNKKGARVTLEVISPYWRTWWFISLALMVFAVLSYLLISFFYKYISMASFWKKQKHVGKFRLMDKLGSGGMGHVYRARNVMDRSESVAVKVLKDELFDDEINRKRFKQEAAIIDQLDHPNIVKVYERGQSQHAMFIAMELLEGITLTEKIETDGSIKIFEALHIMSQMTDALSRIHSKGIIHRDMKPDNVMLITRGEDSNFVKLLDFGLARMQNQTRLTQTGMVIGTINYMAPEQISGKPLSGAMDVYAMGIIFYEMLVGEKPFIGDTTIDIMRQIMDTDPIEPIRFRFDVPSELNELVLNMMEKESGERPTAFMVLDALNRVYGRLKDV